MKILALTLSAAFAISPMAWAGTTTSTASTSRAATSAAAPASGNLAPVDPVAEPTRKLAVNPAQNRHIQGNPAKAASAEQSMRDIVKHRCAQTTLPTTSATLSPWWGLNLAPLNPDLASYFGTQKGALVLSTDSRRYPGLKAGDVITDVNGTSVTTPMDVMRTLRGIATGSSVTWKVLRHHHVQTVTMKAPPTIWHISPMKLPFSGKPHATKVITYTQNNATP